MEWIFKNKIVGDNIELEERECSSCHTVTAMLPYTLYDYCPWCGEKMGFADQKTIKDVLLDEIINGFKEMVLPAISEALDDELKELKGVTSEEIEKQYLDSDNEDRRALVMSLHNIGSNAIYKGFAEFVDPKWKENEGGDTDGGE